MPLKKGKANIGYNVRMEKKKHPNMPQKQAVAIAISYATGKKKTGRKK